MKDLRQMLKVLKHMERPDSKSHLKEVANISTGLDTPQGMSYQTGEQAIMSGPAALNKKAYPDNQAGSACAIGMFKISGDLNVPIDRCDQAE